MGKTGRSMMFLSGSIKILPERTLSYALWISKPYIYGVVVHLGCLEPSQRVWWSSSVQHSQFRATVWYCWELAQCNHLVRSKHPMQPPINCLHKALIVSGDLPPLFQIVGCSSNCLVKLTLCPPESTTPYQSHHLHNLFTAFFVVD